MKKKVISLLLVFALIISVVPTHAFAANGNTASTYASSTAVYVFRNRSGGEYDIRANEYIGMGYSNPTGHVIIIQVLLNRIVWETDDTGFSAGTVDGLFGTNTRNAVIYFQNWKGLSADGIVGPDTWAALHSAYRAFDRYYIYNLTDTRLIDSEDKIY